MKNLPKALAAEFVAMTLFVWIGCGTAVASLGAGGISFHIATSLAFGIGISVLAYTIAPVSGGHINPAVTTSLLILGEIDAVSAVLYIAVQFVAAVLGAALVWGTMLCEEEEEEESYYGLGCSSDPPFNLGSNAVNDKLPLGSGFLIEFMGTFLLVWTVCMTAVSKKSMAGNCAPIAIGWSVLLAHLIMIPHTGCGINPARSFGPHLVVIFSGAKPEFRGWWAFYTAPFLGGAAAAVIYKFIFREEEEVTETVTEEAKQEQAVDA